MLGACVHLIPWNPVEGHVCGTNLLFCWTIWQLRWTIWLGAIWQLNKMTVNRFKDNPYFLSDRIMLVSKLLQDSITFFNNYSLWLILKTRAILSMKTKTTQPLRNFIDMFSCDIFLLCSNWSWCRIINFEALILIFLPYFFNLIDFPRRMFVHAMWEWRRMRSWLYQRELHMRLSCWILRWYLQIR